MSNDETLEIRMGLWWAWPLLGLAAFVGILSVFMLFQENNFWLGVGLIAGSIIVGGILGYLIKKPPVMLTLSPAGLVRSKTQTIPWSEIDHALVVEVRANGLAQYVGLVLTETGRTNHGSALGSLMQWAGAAHVMIAADTLAIAAPKLVDEINARVAAANRTSASG